MMFRVMWLPGALSSVSGHMEQFTDKMQAPASLSLLCVNKQVPTFSQIDSCHLGHCRVRNDQETDEIWRELDCAC